MSLEYEPRVGYSSDLDDDESLKSLVECNQWQSTWKLAKILNMSQSTICCHLDKIGGVNKLIVLVLNALSEKNKVHHYL